MIGPEEASAAVNRLAGLTDAAVALEVKRNSLEKLLEARDEIKQQIEQARVAIEELRASIDDQGRTLIHNLADALELKVTVDEPAPFDDEEL